MWLHSLLPPLQQYLLPRVQASVRLRKMPSLTKRGTVESGQNEDILEVLH